MKCRHCQADVTLPFIDLGTAPPSNAYLTREQLSAPETWYPLRVFTCTRCWLVQTEDYAHHAALFSGDYAYFSSYSSSWLAHSERYVDAMVERFRLGAQSHVVEIAANDGYLLQYVKARGIPCLGVEPTTSTAQTARAKGISIRESFFGAASAEALANEGLAADLMVANNVLAHVPDINDFTAGFARLLKPQGVATFEFPHLMRLVEHCQFDTIYHEHFSYLSFSVVCRILRAGGLDVFDVEELDTHGGSLRVYAQRAASGTHERTNAVGELLERERHAGVLTADYYADLQQRAERIKLELLDFLIDAKRRGQQVIGYGAAAKGNTLLNFAGVRPDLLPAVADLSATKQDKFLPGSRIPVLAPAQLLSARPAYVLILPWNLKLEVMQQLSAVRAWGGKFVIAIPRMEVM